MLTLRTYTAHLIILVLLLITLAYTLPRLGEKISSVATAPVTKQVKPTL